MTDSAIRDTRYAIRDTPYAIRQPIWPIAAVLLLAAVFRFAAIDLAPPGWRDDELIEFDMDRRIVAGWRPLFIAEAEGHEPVYHYLHAATIALFGENIVGYKWLPFAFGVLSVALTYALARRLFDVRTALLAAGLMAVSFWPIMYARLGVRHVGLLPLMLGAFLLLWPYFTAEDAKSAETGSEKTNTLHAIGRKTLAGLLLAAALMTYFAGRALPLILIGFLVYLLVFDRAVLPRVWRGYIGAMVIGALLAAPMFAEIARTPGAEKRTEVVGGPLIAALRGDLKPALDTTLGTLGMFTFAGDPESLYNVPGRPVFDWLTGAAFYLGVLLCFVHLKKAGSGFALVWLLVGIAPAFVSLPAASFSHTIAAQPVVYILAALGIASVARKVAGRSRDGEMGRRGDGRFPRSPLLSFYLSPLQVVSVLLVGFSALQTIRDYFGAWTNDPFVRFQYHASTRDVARWLDRATDVTDVAVGTHPNYLFLDPLALQLDLARQDVRARWFNPGSSVVFPPNGSVIFSTVQPSEIQGQSVFTSSLRLQLRVQTPSGNPSFDVYSAITLWAGWMQPRAAFNDSIQLLEPPSLDEAIGDVNRPGEQATRWTVWYVLRSDLPPQLKLFAHLLDRTGQIIAGDDRLDINMASLRSGDLLAQASNITLPADVPAGQYQIEVGWYSPETGERLHLADGSDRLILGQSIQVTAP